MIKQLRLTKFRQHEDRHFTFNEGLSILRGLNETGKTTIIEGIQYALFGTRALRDSVDAVVTWGSSPSDLRVELDVDEVTVSRSPRGAEVTSMGQVLVSGQTEVTRWCEANIIGSDMSTAMNLMFANQMSLRGVLESGPKATATLIEGLGDFDLFSRLLDAAQANLALGSTALQENRLQRLVEEREALTPVEEPDQETVQHQLNLIQAEADKVGAEYEKLNDAYIKAAAELDDFQRKRQEYQGLIAHRESVESKFRSATAQLKQLTMANLPQQDTSELEERIATLAESNRTLALYEKFMAMEKPEPVQVREEVEQHYGKVDSALAQHRRDVISAEKELAVLESKLVCGDVCSQCGTDVSKLPHVQQRNAELKERIEELGENLTGFRYAAGQAETELQELSKLLNEDKVFRQKLSEFQPHVKIDETMIPAEIEWVSPVPSAENNLESLKQGLTAIREANSKIVQHTAMFKLLSEQQTALMDEATELGKRANELAAPSDAAIRDMEDARNKLLAELTATDELKQSLAAQKREVEEAYSQAETQWKLYVQKCEDVAKGIKEVEDELEQIQFNNLLVRKIRAARPVVGNKLWAIVLGSVSTIFSQMRGEKSVVTRTDEGFMINGRGAGSYSGSTLDILGLALRAALIKTFIPACPLLILDEPGAACDEDRVGNMLGYIAASGFKQVLLVTHEPLSETMADNYIEL